jgi:integrase/recombinase XerC
LRKDRANVDGMYPIYLYANINGNVKYFTINHFIPQKAWNEKKQEVSTRCKNWNIINDDMARYRSRAEKIRIAADEAGDKVSVFEFENVFRSGAKDLKDIFSFIEDDIKVFGNKYRPDTIKMYQSQSRKLKKFSEELPFNELTPFFWKRYDSHLISLGNNPNTRWKAFRFIKTFINKAIENGLLKTDPLKYVKVRKPEGNRANLSIAEIKKLEQLYDGTITKELKSVLGYFLFACFTGIRFRDVVDLKQTNVCREEGTEYIRFVQHKTGDQVTIPLCKKALKYLPPVGISGSPVFKPYCNQATNRMLKDIIIQANINKVISFHCARHSTCSILLELGGDIYTISKILGHRKISTTQLYTKVHESTKRELIELMDAM